MQPIHPIVPWGTSDNQIGTQESDNSEGTLAHELEMLLLTAQMLTCECL